MRLNYGVAGVVALASALAVVVTSRSHALAGTQPGWPLPATLRVALERVESPGVPATATVSLVSELPHSEVELAGADWSIRFDDLSNNGVLRPDELAGFQYADVIFRSAGAKWGYDWDRGVLWIEMPENQREATVADLATALETSGFVDSIEMTNPDASIHDPDAAIAGVLKLAGTVFPRVDSKLVGSVTVSAPAGAGFNGVRLTTKPSPNFWRGSASFDASAAALTVGLPEPDPSWVHGVAAAIDDLAGFDASSERNQRYETCWSPRTCRWQADEAFAGGADPMTSPLPVGGQSLRIATSRGELELTTPDRSNGDELAGWFADRLAPIGVGVTLEVAELVFTTDRVGVDALLDFAVLDDGDAGDGNAFRVAIGDGIRVRGTQSIPEPDAAFVVATAALLTASRRRHSGRGEGADALAKADS